MNEAKPFVVEKRVVMESWLQVKANRGSAGIDGIDLKSYESNLQKNLYKLWNRNNLDAHVNNTQNVLLL